MAYLTPHFEWDVFVSYSHGDPRGSGEAPLKQWSHALIRALESDILALETEFDGLAIWYDERIDPTAALTAQLRDKVQASAILIVLMSPRYLASSSSWCKDELDWFEAQIKDRTRDLPRVFVVRAVSTDETRWPAFIRDERGHPDVGFRFHPVPANPRDTAEPYGWPNLVDRNEAFRKELSRLRTILTRRLRELKAREDKRAQARPTPVAAKPLLYVHASLETAGAPALHSQVKSGLVQAGCDIADAVSADGGDGVARWNAERAARIQRVKGCDALGLVRSPDESVFAGELLDIAVDERERVEIDRGRPLPCAIFDAGGRPLPASCASRGIERFDLQRPGWIDHFRAWLDGFRGLRGSAVP